MITRARQLQGFELGLTAPPALHPPFLARMQLAMSLVLGQMPQAGWEAPLWA